MHVYPNPHIFFSFNFDPLILNYFNLALFCFCFFANLSIMQVPKISLDIAKTQYLGNQKKLQGKIPNKINVKISN
jgi:hypothetical protein